MKNNLAKPNICYSILHYLVVLLMTFSWKISIPTVERLSDVS